jgi:hypothetical protein
MSGSQLLIELLTSFASVTVAKVTEKRDAATKGDRHLENIRREPN